MRRVLDWLEHRTGYRDLFRSALYENVPGGSRWRYVWGSTLVFTLVVQFITGLFLWMAYSPSSHTAWESVYYIQHEMTGGWLLRGIHHHTASLMTVLLVLHLMQVVIDGAYKAPREVNFWFGLVLLLLVLALSLTGYLLPWDQKGYWATKVATNIAGITPVIGPQLQKLIVGGTEYGHHTLTRFFALHAGVIPALIVVLLFWHIYLFRRHGVTAKEPRRGPDQAFWPDQVLKDSVACLAVLAAVLFLVLRPRLFGTGEELGAELGAPADPAEGYDAARPEWYFLFLFQFLKWFPGETEVWGAVIIPSLVLLVVFLMPILGKWRLGHRFNVGCCFALLAGVVLLTYLAIADDRADPAYAAAVRQAERDAERVKVLASSSTGIPDAGAVALLRADPYTQGPKLFARHCSSCHRYDGHDGMGLRPADPQSAPDLKDFGTRGWIAGLLDPDRIATTNYFGGTKFSDGKMAKFVKKKVPAYSKEEREGLQKLITALSAEANLPSQRAADIRDLESIKEGRTLLQDEFGCTDCHQFQIADEDASAPDLTGYASREWLIAFISNPAHPRFYGSRNDRMPAFGEELVLSTQAVESLADWLRGDWYEPEGEVAERSSAP